MRRASGGRTIVDPLGARRSRRAADGL